MTEAKLEQTAEGIVRRSEGWFVVNAHDAAWRNTERFGAFCSFEGDVRFPHFGLNIHVLQPQQPSCHYHGEEAQEDFLVLSGECVLLIDGQERKLKAWDFVHCEPWTEHVFVGAGSGPCAILMVGARNVGEGILYPRSDLALKHGAGVREATPDPKVSYADCPKSTPSRAAEW